MALIVIIAPKDEDVSAAEDALKEAGHTVEVVEAAPANLLHLALGMMGADEQEAAPAEEPEAELEAPADEQEPEAEEPKGSAKDVTEEEDPARLTCLGHCLIDDNNVVAYLGKKTRVFVECLITEGTDEQGSSKKLSFVLGESSYTTWKPEVSFLIMNDKSSIEQHLPVHASKFGKTYLEVGPDLARFF